MNNTGLEVLFESVKNKYDSALNADNALDGKVGALLGFEVAVLIGYLSLIIQAITDKMQFCEGVWGLIVLGFSILLLLYINWPRSYASISVNLFEHPEYFVKSESDLLLQLISDVQNAFTENKTVLHRKTGAYRIAIILLLVAVILLVLSKA